MKILLALLIIGCLALSFGVQANAVLQQIPRNKVANYLSFMAFVQDNCTEPNGGGEVPGPGVPK